MNLNDFSMDPVTLTGSLEAKLLQVKSAGFGQIMLWGKDLVGYAGGFEAAVALVKQSGLRVTGLQVVRDFEGFSGNQHEYRVAVVKATLKMCQAVAAPLLIVCSTTANLPEESATFLADDLRKLANLAVPLGVRIGYKALPWGRFIKSNREAWDLVLSVEHANFALVIDSFSFMANHTELDSLDDIDPAKIALVQLADYSAVEIGTATETHDTSVHMRVFPGDGAHSTQLSEILRRLDRIGYRGDYSFLVFNDDYQQLPSQVVIDHAKRSVSWVTDQVLRRSLPIRGARKPV